MKKALILVLTLLLCLTFTACGGEEKTDAAEEKSAATEGTSPAGHELVGTWTHALGSYIFNADGTGMVETEAITWSVEGDKITMTNTAVNQTMTMQYRIEGNTLIFIHSTGQEMKFTKKVEGESSVTFEPTTDLALVGAWTYKGETITFKADGTGSLDATPLTWSTVDGFVTIVNGNTQKEMTMAYVVDGNNLTVTQMDGSIAVYVKQ